MAPTPDAPAPVPPPARIACLDTLRGFALLGILLMNVQSFAMPGDAYLNPTAYGDLTGANRWAWVLVHVLADQKFINIFSMLFGAGIVLMADRTEPPRFRAVHVRRMAILVAFGLLHGHLLWSGDILYSYGVCGLLLFGARRLRARSLLALALALYAVSTLIMVDGALAMRTWSPERLAAFSRGMWQSTPAEQAAELAAYRGGWGRHLARNSSDATDMETGIFLLYLVWKVAGLMLLGMALARLGVLTGRRSDRFYRRLTVAGLAVGLPVVAYGAWANFRAGWDVRWSFFYGSQFNYWGSVAVSLGWVGAVMLACRAGAFAAARRRLAAVGRTALSNYVLQTVLCTLVFYGTGLGLYGRVSRVGQLGVVAAVWAVQLALAPLWLRRFAFGPLEWLWRSLTYGRPQPLRAASPGAGSPGLALDAASPLPGG
jgi:uncharacterized protein